MDYGMFSKAGNEAIASMITTATSVKAVAGPEACHEYVVSVFSGLSHEGMAECWDTAVRELVCRELDIPFFYS